ncbi:MAG: hypothetical protein RSE00_01560 [Clostridia bacterium]
MEDIFNSIKIEEGGILYKSKGVTNKAYIYAITPITMLDLSIDVTNSILTTYMEFLRELNVDFQILVMNKKLDISLYKKEYMKPIALSKNSKLTEVYKKYTADTLEKLKGENIFTTTYYIIVSQDVEKEFCLEEIDITMFKLKNIGCGIKRIIEDLEIEAILYRSINKEDI